MATHTTIHPLAQLLEDNPHQIAWQGWVAMAAYGATLQETYAMVTIEGLLYTLQDRPTLHTQSDIAITRTINLSDYGFVLNLDVHKPDAFVLAKVNPDHTTLTAYNAFALDTPTTATLADELISHIPQSEVDIRQINHFIDWFKVEEMDEDALMADIAIPAQSNVYNHFPVLYQLICQCMEKVHPDKTHPDALIGKGICQAIPLVYALRTIPQRNGSVTLGWFEAAKMGDKKRLEVLYEKYINSRDEHNNTALMVSARKGHLDCVKWLHRQGADIHAQDHNGNSVLIWSAGQGHLACVTYLLQQGADINAKNKKRNTALTCSAYNGHVDCVKYLLQQGVISTPKLRREIPL